MRKTFILVTLILFILTLTACTDPIIENRTEIEIEVISYKEGDFVPNPGYVALATKALASGDATKYVLYNSLAKSTGTQQYIITVDIGGGTYEVVRNEKFEKGDMITIIQVDTYQGEELITTKYE